MFKRILLITIFMLAIPAYAEFIPSQPVIQVRELHSGMTGHMLTVLQGTKPTKIPVRIMNVVPEKPDKQFANLVLIKILGGRKLAQGMSGSPVYIDGKLAGAIRSGWRDADHTLAVMMPIEYMCKIPEDIQREHPRNVRAFQKIGRNFHSGNERRFRDNDGGNNAAKSGR